MRYADDLIIMVGSKKAAERVMKSVSRYIEEKLGSEQQLQSAEAEPAYPRMDKLLQNREHEGAV